MIEKIAIFRTFAHTTKELSSQSIMLSTLLAQEEILTSCAKSCTSNDGSFKMLFHSKRILSDNQPLIFKLANHVYCGCY